MAMLADHPDVLARLRKEVLDTLGSSGKVNPESLKEMKYLRAVLNGEILLTSRWPSVLIRRRDTEAVSKCVRIKVFLSPRIRLRKASQSMEYQML